MPHRTGVAYEERLRVPWRWWLGGLLAAAVLAAPFAWGDAPTGLRVAAPVLLLAGVAGGLWWLGRVRVAVAGDELWVDDARLPVRFVSRAVPLGPDGRRELLGQSADPLAFVVQRPWVPGAVQVVLADPADPTPYWLVSSRHPERLAAALPDRSACHGAGHGPAG